MTELSFTCKIAKLAKSLHLQNRCTFKIASLVEVPVPILNNHLFAFFNLIEKIEPPPFAIGCASNSDCPDYTACENRKCINPCAEKDPCARNAYCKVIRHKPVCTCPDGYIGDPTTSCELRKYTFLDFTQVVR